MATVKKKIGLRKAATASSGFNAPDAYHSIRRLEAKPDRKLTRVVVASYASIQAYQAGAAPFDTREVELPASFKLDLTAVYDWLIANDTTLDGAGAEEE
jgi:hypothetical protein